MKTKDQALNTPLPRRRQLASVRNKVFLGLLLVTPIMATLWIFNLLLRSATGIFPKKLLPPEWAEKLGPFLEQIVVLVIMLLILYLLGVLAHNFLGKRLYHLADRVFSGIPIIKNIYTFVRQLLEWFAKSRNTMFDAVVLVEYPRRGCYVIGLMTAATNPAIAERIVAADGSQQECVNVFIATTPNPTSGFLIIVPKKDVIPLDMDIADAINIIISGGAILPDKTSTGGAKTMLQIIDSLIMKSDEEPEEPRSSDIPES